MCLMDTLEFDSAHSMPLDSEVGSHRGPLSETTRLSRVTSSSPTRRTRHASLISIPTSSDHPATSKEEPALALIKISTSHHLANSLYTTSYDLPPPPCSTHSTPNTPCNTRHTCASTNCSYSQQTNLGTDETQATCTCFSKHAQYLVPQRAAQSSSGGHKPSKLETPVVSRYEMMIRGMGAVRLHANR